MKLYEIIQSTEEKIHQLFSRWIKHVDKGWLPLENYTINGDGTVDVDGEVLIPNHWLFNGKLPNFIRFRKVTGSFAFVSDVGPTSARGSPEECGSYSLGYKSTVSTYEHFPKIIHKNLTLLHASANTFCGISNYVKKIGEHVQFSGDGIKSGGLGLILTGVPKLYYSGEYGPGMQQWKIIRKYLGRPDDIFDCQAELIDEGFEEFAKL